MELEEVNMEEANLRKNPEACITTLITKSFCPLMVSQTAFQTLKSRFRPSNTSELLLISIFYVILYNKKEGNIYIKINYSKT